MNDFILKLLKKEEKELEEFVNIRISKLLSENNESHFPLNIKPLPQPVAYRYTLDSKKTEIFIFSGLGDVYSYFFDATTEICDSLSRKINIQKPQNFEELSKLITTTIFEYIGGAEVSGTTSDRLSHLTNQDELDKNEKNYISAFKGTQNAWCIERACIAHQLFKFLGFESELVISPIIVDGRREHHAFNLIKLDDRVVMYDATMLDYSKNSPSESCIVFNNLPLSSFDKLQEIPERVFCSKTNQERHCIINPENQPAKIYSKAPEMAK